MTRKEKALARALEWQKNNPERRKEIRAKWIANNMEKMRAIRKAWKKANPEKVNANASKWMKAHPEVRASNESARRARKAGSGGSFTKHEIDDLRVKQQCKCAICKERLSDKFHRDHIIPIALGGGSDISNIQLLCQPCNSRKGAKHPIDYAQQIGMLL